jgi:hypothetical protein
VHLLSKFVRLSSTLSHDYYFARRIEPVVSAPGDHPGWWHGQDPRELWGRTQSEGSIAKRYEGYPICTLSGIATRDFQKNKEDPLAKKLRPGLAREFQGCFHLTIVGCQALRVLFLDMARTVGAHQRPMQRGRQLD